MQQQKQLLDLNDDVLEVILSHLDGRSLINTTETCYKLNDFISTNDKLMKKIVLFVKFPENESTEASLEFMINRMKNLLESNRRYKNLHIRNMVETHLQNEELQQMINCVIRQVGPTINNLELCFIELSKYTEFTEVMDQFKQLKICNLQSIKINEQPIENCAPLSLPCMRELRVSCCDSYCLESFYQCEKMTKLVLIPLNYFSKAVFDMDRFEDFLLKQSHLKDLALDSFYSLHLFDQCKEVKFSLDSLRLHKIFFAHKDIALKFFQTQTKLKKVDIGIINEKDRKLDELQWYEGILKHIFQSPELKQVEISPINYKFYNMDFLKGITNNKVEILKFTDNSSSAHTKANCELFEMMTKMFPNIKKLYYMGEGGQEVFSGIASLKQLEAISIDHATECASFLGSIQITSGKLTEFISQATSPKNGKNISEFLARYPTIKHLTFCTSISKKLCKTIARTLPNLETLSIVGITDAPKLSRSVLKKMTSLQSVTFSWEEYARYSLLPKIPRVLNRPGLAIKYKDFYWSTEEFF
ncbi:unnamed protein product [Diamesa hyperborea]